MEGKERLKLVVEKTFGSTKELYADTFAVETNADDDDDDFKLDDIPEFQLDSELVDDIEALAADERKMLQRDMDADEGDPVGYFDSKPAAAVEETPVAGHTEEDAILLDDDDEDDDNQGEKPSSAEPSDEAAAAAQPQTPAPAAPRRDNANDILGDSRLYNIIFNGPTLGIELSCQSGRVFVSQVKPERRQALGDDCKPGYGDILVAINGTPMSLVPDLSTTISTLKYYLQQPPVELMFLEAPRFAKALFLFTQRQQQMQAAAPAPPSAPPEQKPSDDGGDDVIELLDDE